MDNSDRALPSSVPSTHLSPLERAKASYRSMQSIDVLVGITQRVPVSIPPQSEDK